MALKAVRFGYSLARAKKVDNDPNLNRNSDCSKGMRDV